ncbi:hypothetical protein SB2_11810 [Methylobacterium radiotolerans]|nr:hypothetical protein SB3_11005 [Methylobacterium radiotolerans]KTS47978.1 hypothetical protein SB2_11810 [Methylobacterium radiotolerans]
MDVYKVAVALSMTSNAPAFLSALSSKLLHVHAQVKDLEGGLNRLNRIKLAVGGGLAIAGGTAALAVVGKMVDKGNELVKIQQNMAQAGVKAVEIQEAYAEAWKLTGKYTNVGAAEALKAINEGRAIFGSQHEATHHGEDFVRMISFLKSYNGGKHAGGSMEFEREAVAAIKSAEIAGKVTPKEMGEHLKQLTAMRVMYGDQLKIGQYLTAQRAGGAALRNTSDEFRYGMFPALVQENGPGAGVMLMTAFNKIVAGTGNRTKSLEHMADIGLLKRDMLDYDKNGRVKGLKDPSAIMNNSEAAMNFGNWVMQTLKPKLDNQLTGLTGTRRDIRESQLVAAMFPDRNAQKAIIEVLQQYNKFMKDAALMAQARKQLDKTDEKGYLDKSWEGQKQAFHEQWENFLQALGAPLVGIATENLKKVNAALGGMAQWAARPEMAGTVEAIGKGIAVLGASLTAGGAVALLAALGPAGWLAVGITGAAAAFVAFHEPFEKWLKSTTGMGPALDAADAAFNKAALAFGEWVKAITPSAETMGTLAAKLITEIASWPGRLSAAITEMGTSLVTAIGDMLKSLFSKLNPFSKTAFEGGEGFGGLIQKASFGGGANDNFGSASAAARAMGGGFGAGGGGAAGNLGVGSDYLATIGGKTYRSAYTAAGKERVASWLQMLQRPVGEGGLGMNADKARAMVAMMQGESGINLNPGAVGDHGTAFGTAQWRLGRAANLRAMAAKMGLSASDPRVQQQHFRAEMLGLYGRGGSYRSVYDAIMAAPSGEAALAIGIDKYENPAKKALAYRFRHPYLQGLRRSGAGEVATERPAPTAGPPPKREQWVQVNSTIQMDGRKVGSMISRHQAEAHLFPKAAGGMDTHGGWRAPGTPVTDAA